jgi:hypothetical protein
MRTKKTTIKKSGSLNQKTRRGRKISLTRNPTAEKRERQRVFLEAFGECRGVILDCAKIAGVCREMHYEWLEDPEYAIAFAATKEDYKQRLEAEADRRGHDGYLKPVFHEGKVCGQIREFSDSLLMFRLKKLDPSYREHFKVSGTINHGVDGMREQLRELSKDPAAVELTRQLVDLVIGGKANGQAAGTAAGN